jgi:hypothetical protein
LGTAVPGVSGGDVLHALNVVEAIHTLIDFYQRNNMDCLTGYTNA